LTLTLTLTFAFAFDFYLSLVACYLSLECLSPPTSKLAHTFDNHYNIHNKIIKKMVFNGCSGGEIV